MPRAALLRRRGLSLGIVLLACVRAAADGPPARLDAAGDPLPQGAVARLGTKRLRLPGPVAALALSPDGRTVAVGGLEGPVRLWDAAGGRAFGRLENLEKQEKAATVALAFSPDGRTLAAADERHVRLWDAAAGKLLRKIDVQCGALAFAPDGRALAVAARGGAFQVWEVATGRLLRAVKGGQYAEGRLVAFSPDGKRLFGWGTPDTTLHVWEVETGKELPGLDGSLEASAVAPDGRSVARAGGLMVELLAYPSGNTIWRTDWTATELVFSPDGKLLAATEAAGVRLLQAATGTNVRRLPRGSARPAFSADGKLVAAAIGHAVHVFDAASGAEVAPPPAGHDFAVRSLAFSPDSSVLASEAQDLRLWDVAAAKPRAAPPAGSSSRSRRRARTWRSSAPTRRSWSSTSRAARRCGASPCSRTDAREAAFLAPAKTFASWGESGSIALWDPAGKPFEGLDLPYPVLALAPSRDGRSIAVLGAAPSAGENPTLALWSLASREEVWKIAAFGAPAAVPPAFLDAKTLAALNAERAVQLVDAATGRPLRAIGSAGTAAFAASPDGKTIAAARDDSTVGLWDVATGLEWKKLAGHEGRTGAVAFSADGKLLATGGDDTTVLVWDLAEK